MMRRIVHGLLVSLFLLAPTGLFAAAPKITSFTPASGVAGTSVTLTGTSFTGATSVKFNGKAASSYTVLSATSIRAVAPTGVTTGKLSVTTAGGTATSAASFTVLTAPAITTQPANRAVTLGSTATFTVVATGTAPLTYQWSKNGAAISGATSASYITPATQTTDNGALFRVAVTNAYGSVVSSPATLTLNLPPAITTQPAPQTVNIGSTAGFTVVASGTGALTYQWSKNGISITGATSASYTTPATGTGDNAATFTVKVTNAYGNITSAAAILTVTVLPPTTPVITAPNPVTAAQAGYTATVPIQAGCTYAWTINGGIITAGSATNKITFTPSGTGTMTTARTGHAAVLLPDGRILVTGGTDSLNTVLATAEVFNPAQGVFSPTTTPMASRRVNHTATLLTDGRVLIVGGFDETFTTLASAEIFDPATGSFSTLAGALATARGYQTATSLPSGKVLLAGGWNTSGGILTSAEIFDPVAGAFSDPVASMASARYSHTATLLTDGSVLIAGGDFDGIHLLGTAEIFDPSTNVFRATAGPMASVRRDHTATLLADGRILLAGGNSGFTSAERFDPASGLFEATASPMVTPRWRHAATLLPNGQVLLVGGTGPEGSLAGGELFDPLVNGFTAAPGSMAVPREGFTATPASNGQVLLVGGYNYSPATGTSTTHASLDIYDPATPLLGYMSSTLGCTVTNSLGSASPPGTLKVLVLPALATPTITAQTSVVEGRGGYIASVPAQYGCTYTWTITNGTITNGAGTPAVTFSAGVLGTSLKLSCVVANAAGSSKTANATLTVAPSFLTLTPSTALLAPGGQQAFTANQPVNWSLDAGSISYTSTSATYKASVYGTDLGVGTYTLTATSRADSSLSASAYITVFVAGSPIITSFSASPASIHAGQSTTLNWTESNATVLNIDPYVGPWNGNSVTVAPMQTTTYTLSASNDLGIVTARLTVGVDLVPSITAFAAAPSLVNAGGTTQFSAAFTNGTGQINPGAHPILSGATIPAQLEGTTVYTLAVTNPYGATATADARVDVTGPGAFLPTLALAAPHPSALSTRLSDGRVFLTGGLPFGGTLVQFFSPETGAFQLGSGLREGRGRSTAARLADDRVLLWAGAVPGTNINFLNSYEVVDPGRGTSTVHAITSSGLGGVSYTNSIVYRCDHTATRLADGRVLIMGGRSLRDGVTYSAWAGDRVTLATALLVDPSANQGPPVGFSVTGSMGISRADFVAIRLLDGRVLVAGGTHADGQAGTMYYSEAQLTSAELFDPATGTWSAAGDLHDSRHAQNPVLLPDGRVIFDGREVFDPATNAFTLIPDPYKGFSGFGTGALLLPDGRILMSSVHADARPLLYDPVKNLCTGVSAPYPAGNYLGGGYQSMTLLQEGTALLIGRRSPGVATPMAEADHFDPQAELSITPAMGFTNVGVPLSLHASGPKASGVTWTSIGGAVLTDGTFMSPVVGLFPVTATAPDGTRATILVEVGPGVKVVFDLFTYPGMGPILNAGVAGQFKAHVQNTPDQRLTWSLQEGPAAGTITANGLFTAASAGTWHIIATSVADPTQSATFTITTAPPIALSVQPLQLTVLPGQEVTFTITEPTGQTAISLDAPGILYPNFVGTITYKAPITPGTYNLTATSILDPTKSVVMVLTVVPIVDFFITPPTMVMRPGGSSTFKAYARSSEGLQDVSERVSWSVTNGSFMAGKDAYGIYRTIYFAPSSPGTSTVTAVMSGTMTSAQSLVTILPAEAFATAGFLTANRRGHTMTRLLDGRILIAGGWNSTAEIYDPTTKSFTVIVATMQRRRAGHTATLLPDGKVLIVGGDVDSIGVLAEVYDPATQTFSPTAGSPFHLRSNHFAVPLPNGKILIAGGLDGSSQRTLEIYEPVSGTFSLAGALNGTRLASKGAATLMADGRVIFVGPANGAVGGLPGSSEVYDFRTGTSTSAANPNLTCWSPSLIPAADGGVWSFSGDVGNLAVDSAMEQFNPGTGTFTIGPKPIVNDPANVTELVDGSIWASGWHADYPNSNNLHGMRFLPGSGVYADAIYFPTHPQNYDMKAILLPTGDVLETGYDGFGSSQAAGLLVFDTVPNAIILPRRITLLGGCSWSFQASSTGLGNAGFTWSIQEGPGGGSITSQGVYTAPFTPGTYHIVATSTVDGAVQATAVVDVISGAEVSILPALIQVQPGTTRSFQASLVGLSDTRVDWTSSQGTINVDGVFTAPMTEGTCTVMATSVAQPDRSGTATVVVKAGAGSGGIPLPVLHAFTADTPAVLPGQPVRFSWSTSYATFVQLECTSCGFFDQFKTMDVTRLSSIAIYPLGTVTYRLKVTNPSGVITSQILSVSLWTSPVTLTLTPQSASLYVGQPQQFGFTLSAPTNRLAWSATGGSVTPGGLYTAPATPGTYQVSVQSVDDPSKSATATVVVLPPDVTLGVLPASAELNPGQGMTFATSIQVTGSQDQSLLWYCDGGTLVAKGAYAFYAAPLVPGFYTVTALSAANPAVSASATVQVHASSSTVARLGVSPMSAALNPGQRVFLGSDFAVSDPQSGLDWTSGAGSLAPDPTGATAFYTAPSAAGPDAVTVKGRAHMDLLATIQLSMEAPPGPAFSVMPVAASLGTGQTMLLEAMDAQGRILPNPIWTIQEAQGGLITGAGMYVAPLAAGIYHVVATHPDDPSQTATATLTVVSGGGGGPGGGTEPTDAGITLSPDRTQIPAGTFQSFSALVKGLDDQGVTWAVENNPAQASVDGQGAFVASQQGTYRIFATSTADPTRNGSAVITVLPSVTPIAGAPAGAWRGYSVTALKDGRILLAGGSGGVNVLSAGYLFDPLVRTFTPTPPMTRARNWHADQLMEDGRVLITGGLGNEMFLSGPDYSIRNAEVFNPATGAFESLPVPPTSKPSPMPGQARGTHDGGSAVKLGNGQVMVVGGEYFRTSQYGWWSTCYADYRRSDLFDPASNTFDVSNYHLSVSSMWDPSPNCFETYPGQTAVALDDGRALITGGNVWPVADSVDPCTGAPKTPLGGAGAYPYTACVKNAAMTYTAGGGTTQLNPMNSPRSFHTMTRLADGRILIVGGHQAITCTTPATRDPNTQMFEPDMKILSTASAEIYDPATGTFTPTGSLSVPRSAHAAILLPTGQVLIVGGTSQDGMGSHFYPKTTELYDPYTGTFRVMDHLDYGLSEPKLALMQDGSVFVAGQVQAPMEAPTAQQSQSNGLKMMAAADLAGNTLTSGSTLMGVISSSWNVIACPEEASLKYDKVAKVHVPEIGDTWHEGLIPKKATISVPMAGGVNEENRYFILKIKKPSPNYSITGFAVTLKAGNQNQVVNGPISADYSQLFSRSDVTYFHELPAPPGDLTQEGEREYLRKQWLQAWLPASNPSDRVTEFYKVRVTMKTYAPSAIQYGVNGQLPPSDTLSYEFKIFYTLNGISGQPYTLPPWNTPTTIQAHWDASPYFQNSWYGDWNNDKWARKATFDWMANLANRALLEPLNDISLEHGRNTGHAGHLSGNEADAYHPGYQAFTHSDTRNASGGDFRDSYLIPYLQIARGDLVNPNISRAHATQVLTDWIGQARSRVYGLMTQSRLREYGPDNFIFMCRNTESTTLTIRDCYQLRRLLLVGACLPYSVGGTTYQGLDLVPSVGVWGVEETKWTGLADTSHTDHLHCNWATKAIKFDPNGTQEN